MLPPVWKPLNVRYGPEPVREKYDALAEGVPTWLADSLWAWATKFLLGDDPYGNARLNDDLRMALERLTKQKLSRFEAEIEAQCRNAPDLFLSLVDALLILGEGADAHELAHFLEQGGSAWEVAPSGRALTRRVSPESRAVAEEVMSAGDKAGKHIALAWQHAYGRSPDAKSAYREAVAAVEAAAIPVVIPNDPTATLGKVIKAMSDGVKNLECSFKPPEGFDPVGAVISMCQLLWKGQRDRHGSDKEEVPLSVDMDEAQPAVHLAVTLVHIFTKGHIRRR